MQKFPGVLSHRHHLLTHLFQLDICADTCLDLLCESDYVATLDSYEQSYFQRLNRLIHVLLSFFEIAADCTAQYWHDCKVRTDQ